MANQRSAWKNTRRTKRHEVAQKRPETAQRPPRDNESKPTNEEIDRQTPKTQEKGKQPKTLFEGGGEVGAAPKQKRSAARGARYWCMHTLTSLLQH